MSVLITLPRTGDLPCDLPSIDILWTRPATPPMIQIYPPVEPVLSDARSVWKEVQEWYKARGQGVPADESRECMRAITAEKAAAAAWAIELEKMASLPPAPQKAAYGTPEFWKDYWAKKKAAGYVSKKDLAAAPAAAKK